MTLENPIPRVHHSRRHIVSSVVFVIIMVDDTSASLSVPTPMFNIAQAIFIHLWQLYIICVCKIPCGATVEVVDGKCENGKFNQFFKTTLCRRVAFMHIIALLSRRNAKKTTTAHNISNSYESINHMAP